MGTDICREIVSLVICYVLFVRQLLYSGTDHTLLYIYYLSPKSAETLQQLSGNYDKFVHFRPIFCICFDTANIHLRSFLTKYWHGASITAVHL